MSVSISGELVFKVFIKLFLNLEPQGYISSHKDLLQKKE